MFTPLAAIFQSSLLFLFLPHPYPAHKQTLLALGIPLTVDSPNITSYTVKLTLVMQMRSNLGPILKSPSP